MLLLVLKIPSMLPTNLASWHLQHNVQQNSQPSIDVMNHSLLLACDQQQYVNPEESDSSLH